MSSPAKRARGAAASPERGGAQQGGAGAVPARAATLGDGAPSPDLPGVAAQPPAAVQQALPPLPEAVALLIFGLLSVEERLRAREVSPAWRAALHSSSVWSKVDLCHLQGAPAERCARVLATAARLAAGDMMELRLALPDADVDAVTSLNEAVVRAAVVNAAKLCLLDVSYYYIDIDSVSRVLETCTALTSFTLQHYGHDLVSADAASRLVALLSGDGIFAPVRVCGLQICSLDHTDGLQAALERHTSLRELSLGCSMQRSHEGDVALACAAARAGVIDLEFSGLWDGRSFTQAAAAVLLSDLKHVQRLNLSFGEFAGGDDWVPQFVTALPNHQALRALTLHKVLFDDDNVELIHAMTGHPSLEELTLDFCDTRVAGSVTALAQLLAARSALTDVAVTSMISGGDRDLLTILEGLSSPNTRIAFLDVSISQDMGPEVQFTTRFAAGDLYRAIRPCASLREVRLVDPRNDDVDDRLVEIERAINVLLSDAGRELRLAMLRGQRVRPSARRRLLCAMHLLHYEAEQEGDKDEDEDEDEGDEEDEDEGDEEDEDDEDDD
jgi:hypothetical protein